MPKIVAPIGACSEYIRVQGQRTGKTLKIRAGFAAPFDVVFADRAKSPDEMIKLSRRLQSGEIVFVDGVPASEEQVEPAPAQNELGYINADSHLHSCGRCATFANGYPGADIVVTSATGGPIGRGVVDPASGVAHVHFDPPLIDGDDVSAQQLVCNMASSPTPSPKPDNAANVNGKMSAPVLPGPLHECERAIWIEDIAEGALVRLFRDGQEVTSACFAHSAGWLRLHRELQQSQKIKVDQQFPGCELWSPPSEELTVDVPQRPNAPALLGPFCKGTLRIGVGDLRYGARVRIVQTSEAQPGTLRQALQTGEIIGDEEAWDTQCDVPLIGPLDPADGEFVFAYQTLCDLHSPASNRGMPHEPEEQSPAPELRGPLVECSSIVRVTNITPGARVQVYTSRLNEPGFRTNFDQYVFAKSADVTITPGLFATQQVFVRQIACGQTSDTPMQTVAAAPPLEKPVVEDCGIHLHITHVVPGAFVEVYLEVDNQDVFFRAARSGSASVTIPLAKPLPDGTILKARQTLCKSTSLFSGTLTVEENVTKRRLEIVPVGVPGHPEFSSERVCQLTGTTDPEGKPILNNCAAAWIKGTDLGIVVDHTTGDGRLYFFFGDSGVEDDVDDFPEAGDVLARTDAAEAGKAGPSLEFRYDIVDGDPAPRALGIHGVSLATFEVPTGGFSHAGKLYLFASTDRFHANPRTERMGKDDNFMGQSVLATTGDWVDWFHMVPGHESISSRSRDDPDPMMSEFKFINIAPWKVRNSDWKHLPESAQTCEHGLFLIGTGRYRESQPSLAYVPLPDGDDPVFTEWRFLSGYGDPATGTGPCGRPLWSKEQKDAIYLWDDRELFPLFDANPNPPPPEIRRTTPNNAGVLGEISMAYLPSVGLFVALYHGTRLRSAEYPWGPWSDPIDLYAFWRDHRNLNPNPGDPPDPRPNYAPNGEIYGPYIVPRFTEHDPVIEETTIYHALSFNHPLYQVELLKTRVRLVCGGAMNFACGKKGEVL